jgi:hypothetical protein
VKNFKTILSDLTAYLVPATCFWFFLILLILIRGNKGGLIWLNRFRYQPANEVIAGIRLLTTPLILAAIAALLLAKPNTSALLLTIGALLIAFYIYFPLKYQVFEGQSFPSVHALGVSVVFTGVAWSYRQVSALLTAFSMMACGLYYISIYKGNNFPLDILLSGLLGTLITLIFILLYQHKITRWFTVKSKWAQGIIIASLRTIAIMVILINFKQLVHI